MAQLPPSFELLKSQILNHAGGGSAEQNAKLDELLKSMGITPNEPVPQESAPQQPQEVPQVAPAKYSPQPQDVKDNAPDAKEDWTDGSYAKPLWEHPNTPDPNGAKQGGLINDSRTGEPGEAEVSAKRYVPDQPEPKQVAPEQTPGEGSWVPQGYNSTQVPAGQVPPEQTGYSNPTKRVIDIPGTQTVEPMPAEPVPGPSLAGPGGKQKGAREIMKENQAKQQQAGKQQTVPEKPKDMEKWLLNRDYDTMQKIVHDQEMLDDTGKPDMNRIWSKYGAGAAQTPDQSKDGSATPDQNSTDQQQNDSSEQQQDDSGGTDATGETQGESGDTIDPTNPANPDDPNAGKQEEPNLIIKRPPTVSPNTAADARKGASTPAPGGLKSLPAPVQRKPAKQWSLPLPPPAIPPARPGSTPAIDTLQPRQPAPAPMQRDTTRQSSLPLPPSFNMLASNNQSQQGEVGRQQQGTIPNDPNVKVSDPRLLASTSVEPIQTTPGTMPLLALVINGKKYPARRVGNEGSDTYEMKNARGKWERVTNAEYINLLKDAQVGNEGESVNPPTIVKHGDKTFEAYPKNFNDDFNFGTATQPYYGRFVLDEDGNPAIQSKDTEGIQDVDNWKNDLGDESNGQAKEIFYNNWQNKLDKAFIGHGADGNEHEMSYADGVHNLTDAMRYNAKASSATNIQIARRTNQTPDDEAPVDTLKGVTKSSIQDQVDAANETLLNGPLGKPIELKVPVTFQASDLLDPVKAAKAITDIVDALPDTISPKKKLAKAKEWVETNRAIAIREFAAGHNPAFSLTNSTATRASKTQSGSGTFYNPNALQVDKTAENFALRDSTANSTPVGFAIPHYDANGMMIDDAQNFEDWMNWWGKNYDAAVTSDALKTAEEKRKYNPITLTKEFDDLYKLGDPKKLSDNLEDLYQMFKRVHGSRPPAAAIAQLVNYYGEIGLPNMDQQLQASNTEQQSASKSTHSAPAPKHTGAIKGKYYESVGSPNGEEKDPSGVVRALEDHGQDLSASERRQQMDNIAGLPSTDHATLAGAPNTALQDILKNKIPSIGWDSAPTDRKSKEGIANTMVASQLTQIGKLVAKKGITNDFEQQMKTLLGDSGYTKWKNYENVPATPDAASLQNAMMKYQDPRHALSQVSKMNKDTGGSGLAADIVEGMKGGWLPGPDMLGIYGPAPYQELAESLRPYWSTLTTAKATTEKERFGQLYSLFEMRQGIDHSGAKKNEHTR